MKIGKLAIPAELDSEANSMRAGEVVLFAILIGTLSILIHGYYYGSDNQIEQLPMVFRLLDSSYLTEDFFVNATTDFGPRDYYSRTLARLGSYFPLPLLYLFLTWLSNVSVALVTYVVARRSFQGSNLTGMVACILVMGVQSISLGGSLSLRSSELITSWLFTPLLLLSLWLGIARRPLSCAGLSALVSIFHPVFGLEIGAIGLATAGLSVLLELDNKKEHALRGALIPIGKVAAAGTGLGIFALFVWIFPYDASIDSAQFIDIFARFRHPHHCLPSTFGIKNYLAALCFLVAFAISWKWWYEDPMTDKSLARRILIPIIIILGLCVGGYLFVEVFPSRLWATALMFRLLFVVKWLALLVVAGAIARILRRSGTFEQTYSGWLMLGGSGFAQPFLMLFGHIVELLRRRLKSVLPARTTHLGLGTTLIMAGMILIGFGSMRESLAVLLFVAISLWFSLLPRGWYRSLIPILSLSAVLFIFVVDRHYQIPLLSPYLNRMQPIITLSDIKGADIEIAGYAGEIIREDAVFLTPPSFGRFRFLARRAIVVDFKAIPFQDRAMVEWRERLRDCYGEVESSGFRAVAEMDRSYRNITSARILSVAEKYGASYAILYRETESEFPVVFENDSYKIVGISGESDSRT
jgi:hypothetical protein